MKKIFINLFLLMGLTQTQAICNDENYEIKFKINLKTWSFAQSQTLSFWSTKQPLIIMMNLIMLQESTKCRWLSIIKNQAKNGEHWTAGNALKLEGKYVTQKTTQVSETLLTQLILQIKSAVDLDIAKDIATTTMQVMTFNALNRLSSI